MVALQKSESAYRTDAPIENEKKLQTIVVAGVASGAGKTSLAEAVVRILAKNYATAAAKITVTHGERGCPHGGKGCNVCSSLGGDFQVITKPTITEQAGTDTARLGAAGAHPVLWTITRYEMIAQAWDRMIACLSGEKLFVVESNTLAQTIQPALTLMIVDPTVSRRLWKPSASGLIKTADLVVFNERGTQIKKEMAFGEVLSLRGSSDRVIRVNHPHDITVVSTLLERLAIIAQTFD